MSLLPSCYTSQSVIQAIKEICSDCCWFFCNQKLLKKTRDVSRAIHQSSCCSFLATEHFKTKSHTNLSLLLYVFFLNKWADFQLGRIHQFNPSLLAYFTLIFLHRSIFICLLWKWHTGVVQKEAVGKPQEYKQSWHSGKKPSLSMVKSFLFKITLERQGLKVCPTTTTTTYATM